MNDNTMPILTLKNSAGGSDFTYRLFRSVVCREDTALELWSVTVTEQRGGLEESCLLCDVAENAAEAESAVRFLCGNTVSPCHAAEVFAQMGRTDEKSGLRS